MLKIFVLQNWLIIYSQCIPSSNMYWTNVTHYTAMVIQQEPHGILYTGRLIYICKMYADSRWITGSFSFVDDGHTSDCSVVTFRRAYYSKEFQVLMYPPGTTSWIPFTGQLPADPVLGGSHRHNVPGYICRARWKHSLVVGISAHDGRVCYIPLDGNEVYSNYPEKI